MIVFWKASALVILTVILGTALGKTEKDFTVVLTIATCCMVAVAALQYLEDVIAFIWELGKTLKHQNACLDTLLKVSGVALMTEITAQISNDTGNASLGKVMQILGTSVILSLSLPLFETLIVMIREILRIV